MAQDSNNIQTAVLMMSYAHTQGPVQRKLQRSMTEILNSRSGLAKPSPSTV